LTGGGVVGAGEPVTLGGGIGGKRGGS